jgi:hypothetical protein
MPKQPRHDARRERQQSLSNVSQIKAGKFLPAPLTLFLYHDFSPLALLAEGRQPVTFGGWSGCGARGRASSARTREAAVERREARRPTSLAGDPWRSRDRPQPQGGPRIRRSVSAPLGAPLPSRCAGRKNEKGEARPPSKNQPPGGTALAVWQMKSERAFTLPCRGRGIAHE